MFCVVSDSLWRSTWLNLIFPSLSCRQREKSKQTDGSPLALFNMFIERVREQVHVVLAMSPIGDAFRNRLRKFPSLVNCCTIDWFQVCQFQSQCKMLVLSIFCEESDFCLLLWLNSFPFLHFEKVKRDFIWLLCLRALFKHIQLIQLCGMQP